MAAWNKLSPRELTPERRAEFLDKTKWALDFDYKDLELMSTYMQAYRAEKNQTVVSEGDPPAMIVIVRGALDIFDNSGEMISRVSQGNAFGEVSLVDQKPHKITAIAPDQAAIFVLTATGYKELLQQEPAVAIHAVVNQVLRHRMPY